MDDKYGNFEKEVISIPAGKTVDFIYKYDIHAHPANRNYKSSKYITFREPGGIMKKLYSIDKTIDIDTNNMNEIYKYSLNDDEINRVLKYTEERKNDFGYKHNEGIYKFYILKHEKDLRHNPRKPRLQSHCYLTYDELIN